MRGQGWKNRDASSSGAAKGRHGEKARPPLAVRDDRTRSRRRLCVRSLHKMQAAAAAGGKDILRATTIIYYLRRSDDG